MLDGRMVTRYGSDGLFLRKYDDGTLILTWSPYPENRYMVLSAVSDTGSIRGWEILVDFL
jgi:hypothetical protein